ncbi:hypothetical protein, partial [uncultured Ruminobacter sp.]|uniref:hypothetical protein n=1 Tax=uncultured Ruminobacter sp. TaxID=538947 RepID=UPI0025D2F17E
ENRNYKKIFGNVFWLEVVKKKNYSWFNLRLNSTPLQSLREWLYTINESLRCNDNILFIKIINNVLWGNHGSKRIKKMLRDINSDFNKNYLLLIKDAIKKKELPENVDPVKASNFLCSVITGYIMQYVDGAQSDIVDFNKPLVDMFIEQLPKFIF